MHRADKRRGVQTGAAVQEARGEQRRRSGAGDRLLVAPQQSQADRVTHGRHQLELGLKQDDALHVEGGLGCHAFFLGSVQTRVSLQIELWTGISEVAGKWRRQ